MNDRPHIAQVSIDFLRVNYIAVLPWISIHKTSGDYDQIIKNTDNAFIILESYFSKWSKLSIPACNKKFLLTRDIVAFS
jgi:hypothetical protein